MRSTTVPWWAELIYVAVLAIGAVLLLALLLLIKVGEWIAVSVARAAHAMWEGAVHGQGH